MIRDFTTQLAPLVARIRETFPWYDHLVRECGYDLDGDPERLPYIDEAILTQHYYTAEHNGLAGAHTYFTSGTSNGARKKILYSDEDHGAYVQHRQKIFSRFLSGSCKTACADLGTGHAAASAKEVFDGLGLESLHIDCRKPVQEHLAILNSYQPDVIFTMPMILDSIIHTNEANFRLRKVIVVGDVATRSWKDHIVNFFSLQRRDLLDVVGSIEIGSIAYECFDCDSYHFDEHIIPEAVTPSRWFAGVDYPDDIKILVLTSTSRRLFPAIRFVTNDLIQGFTQRMCGGKTCFTFDHMIGRLGNELKAGEKISLYDVSEAVNRFLPGSRFDVYKDSARLVIRVCSNNFTADAAEKIRTCVKDLNPSVDQMIKSSLVQDIEVCSITSDQLTQHSLKKSFLNLNNR